MKFKESLLEFKPYFVEEKEVPIKLDANENPFDMPNDLKIELFEELKNIEINRYPDSNIKELKKLISENENIPFETIIFGNGSDEFIYMLYMALDSSAKVAYPEPGFSMYRIVGKIFDLKLKPYILSEPDFEITKKTLEKLLKSDIDLIFLGNPNNPTGNIFPEEYAEMILSKKDTLVVSDEAYYNYSKNTLIEFLKKHKNLLIMRSFSKVGFASIRLGYMMGSKEVIEKLNMIRSPYNINSFTQKIASFYFKYKGIFEKQIEEIIQERERLMDFFKKKKIFAIPSKANFISFKIEKEGLYNFLLERGIKIKDLSHSFNMKNFYRVTIGKKQENDRFKKTIEKFMEI